MNLLRKNRTHTYSANQYATNEEFRRVFSEDMRHLYLLSFVLTANHEKAEQCFVAGLEDCVKSSPVFRQWAGSWAKRMILKNAIRVVSPLPNRDGGTSSGTYGEPDYRRQGTHDQQAAIASVLALKDFDRFVFVIAVLECYTVKECSILLDCSQRDVYEARMRAMQQIAEYTRHEDAGHGSSIQSSGHSPEMLAHYGLLGEETRYAGDRNVD
jgi:hypothetical protein